MTENTGNTMLLSESELRELTEYKHRAKQQERLSMMGIPFRVGRYGRPVVLRDAVVQRLGGSAVGTRQQTALEPDYGALAEELQGGS